jgi:glutamate carboxypeptidase
MTDQELQAYARDQSGRLLSEIQELVSIESPSHDPGSVNRAMDWAQARLQAAGVASTRVPHESAGDQLIARWGAGSRRTLLLGHLDTVWDQGQLSRMPLRLEQGKAYGPGIFDMKAGAVLMLELLRMAALGVCRFPAALTAFFNSDEETGSLTSRHLLEATAHECDQVLVFEPSLPGGRVKTFRKGVATYQMEVFGRAAHAGVDPEKGVSAIEEFVQQALSIRKLKAEYPGASITIGVVRGGSRSNVVPDHLEAEIDVRLVSTRDADELDRELRALRASFDGARVIVSGGLNRPPLERTAGVVSLYGNASAVAARQGWELQEGSTGGGSDGSFTAALGIPTLDGLGPDGDGAHALHEHIIVEDLPRRLALAAGLLQMLE